MLLLTGVSVLLLPPLLLLLLWRRRWNRRPSSLGFPCCLLSASSAADGDAGASCKLLLGVGLPSNELPLLAPLAPAEAPAPASWPCTLSRVTARQAIKGSS